MGVVTVGVDSHKSSLAVAVLDDVGREIGVREFPNDAKGHDSLAEWVARFGSECVIGIEGSGNYGAGLARHLLERGDHVCEVPAFLSHRERKKRPSVGKSDAQDAVAIARVVARGEGLSSPQRSEAFADLKLLSDHRDQLIRSRTQLINRTHKDLVVSHPGYEKLIPKLTSKKNLQAATTLLRGDRSIRADLIRERIGEAHLWHVPTIGRVRLVLKVHDAGLAGQSTPIQGYRPLSKCGESLWRPSARVWAPWRRDPSLRLIHPRQRLRARTSPIGTERF